MKFKPANEDNKMDVLLANAVNSEMKRNKEDINLWKKIREKMELK